MKRIIGSAVIGIAIGASASIPITIYSTRERPAFLSLVLTSPSIHAGDAIGTNKQTVIPDDCIPRIKRWIEYDDGVREVLTDAPGPNNGPLAIPTSMHLRVGCGAYHEQMVDQSCGWMSGFFPPLAANARPVRLCVLPPTLPPPPPKGLLP